MFSSVEYLDNINEIPTQWILQHYLKLPYKLTGQTVKVKSFFNPADKDPSMTFYWWKDRYVFKDYSANKRGSVIHAMMKLFNMDFINTSDKIKKDYFEFKRTGNVAEIELEIQEFEWIAQDVTCRKWNTLDAKYWLKLNVNSNLLLKYKIKPLQKYTIAKVEKESRVVLDSFSNDVPKYVYGYFKVTDDIFKIYRPYWKNRKFMTLDPDYLQGRDQLEGHPYLIVASSMKDLLVIKSLNLSVDVVAPNSENTFLTDEDIEDFKSKYKAIITLFDPDKQGIKSMQDYLNKFQIPFCYLPYKDDGDIADMMVGEGKDYVMAKAIPGINKAVEKYITLQKENEKQNLSNVVF